MNETEHKFKNILSQNHIDLQGDVGVDFQELREQTASLEKETLNGFMFFYIDVVSLMSA